MCFMCFWDGTLERARHRLHEDYVDLEAQARHGAW